MNMVDFGSPRSVCSRIATIHLAEAHRAETVADLRRQSLAEARERAGLEKLLLAMAPDGTATRVEVPRPGGQWSANAAVALVVDRRSVACYEIAETHDIAELDDTLVEHVLAGDEVAGAPLMAERLAPYVPAAEACTQEDGARPRRGMCDYCGKLSTLEAGRSCRCYVRPGVACPGTVVEDLHARQPACRADNAIALPAAVFVP